MTPEQCLDYEVRSSWRWVKWLHRGPMSNLMSAYFAWKVKRKYNRWFDSKFDDAYVELLGDMK